jgi:outer membrane lipoprotein-sorting protein
LKTLIALWFLVGLAIAGNSAIAVRVKSQEAEQDPAKAAALIQSAINARGGDAYLKIHTLVGRGEYTPFAKGEHRPPDQFVDYIAYPNRERTDFGRGDQKVVQANIGEKGWVYDAQQKSIHDQTPEQIKRAQQESRFDLENLLRGGWKADGAKANYLNRREVWKDTFAEAVRIDFSDGASVTMYFDRQSKLPLMVESKIVEEEGAVNHQVRYYQWLDFNGIKFARIQDSYRNGQQSARTVYTSFDFNASVPDKMFAKPASVKEVK